MAGDKGTHNINLVGFRRPYCIHTWFRHKIYDCHSGCNGRSIGKYWAELTWNIASLFGRQMFLSVAVTGDNIQFGRVLGAVKN